MRSRSASAESGFSLVEVMIAAGLLATTLVSLAELFALSTRSNGAARATSEASVLAAQKMEELRALAWGFDAAGTPTADLTSDTTVSPELSAGGTGLTPSPVTSLQEGTPGWVDYVDQFGDKIASADGPPQNAMFVRRWSVQSLPADPADTLLLQVLVTRNRNRGAADRGAVARLPEEARLVTIKTRKAP
jgi:type II secretory pathway pseudopilin PulG